MRLSVEGLLPRREVNEVVGMIVMLVQHLLVVHLLLEVGLHRHTVVAVVANVGESRPAHHGVLRSALQVLLGLLPIFRLVVEIRRKRLRFADLLLVQLLEKRASRMVVARIVEGEGIWVGARVLRPVLLLVWMNDNGATVFVVVGRENVLNRMVDVVFEVWLEVHVCRRGCSGCGGVRVGSVAVEGAKGVHVLWPKGLASCLQFPFVVFNALRM